MAVKTFVFQTATKLARENKNLHALIGTNLAAPPASSSFYDGNTSALPNRERLAHPRRSYHALRSPSLSPLVYAGLRREFRSSHGAGCIGRQGVTVTGGTQWVYRPCQEIISTCIQRGSTAPRAHASSGHRHSAVGGRHSLQQDSTKTKSQDDSLFQDYPLSSEQGGSDYQ